MMIQTEVSMRIQEIQQSAMVSPTAAASNRIYADDPRMKLDN